MDPNLAPHHDPEVQAVLTALDPQDALRMLDALDILFQAGADGLFAADWLNQLRCLHGSVPDEFLGTIVQHCGALLRGDMTSRIRWLTPAERDVGEIDHDTANSVRMTSLCLDLMRRLGRFSRTGLACALAREGALPDLLATELVEHILMQFPASLVRHPDGSLSFRTEPEATRAGTLASLRAQALHPDLRLTDPGTQSAFRAARRRRPEMPPDPPTG